MFRPVPAAIAVLLLSGPLSRAQDSGPPLGLTSGGAASVTITGGSPLLTRWRVSPETGRHAAGQTLVIWGPPGQYTVTAAVLLGTDVGLYQTTVTIPGAAPVPGPTPTPTPTPAPPSPVPIPTPSPPAVGKIWALAIFDTTQQLTLPAGQLAIWKSQTLGPTLAASGVTYRHYDVSDPAVTGSTWGQAALKLKKPALVLYRDGAVMPGYPVNLPATEADLIRLIHGDSPTLAPGKP